MCVYVCVRACVRACAGVCTCVYVYVSLSRFLKIVYSAHNSGYTTHNNTSKVIIIVHAYSLPKINALLYSSCCLRPVKHRDGSSSLVVLLGLDKLSLPD